MCVERPGFKGSRHETVCPGPGAMCFWMGRDFVQFGSPGWVIWMLGDWSAPSPSPWLVGHNGVSKHLDTHQKGHSALLRVEGCS